MLGLCSVPPDTSFGLVPGPGSCLLSQGWDPWSGEDPVHVITASSFLLRKTASRKACHLTLRADAITV